MQLRAKNADFTSLYYIKQHLSYKKTLVKQCVKKAI